MSKLVKKIVKFKKKLASKIHRGVKKVVKGIGKAFKKFASSTIGKVIIAAVLIWFGGAYLGWWGGPAAGGGAAGTASGVAGGAAGGAGAAASTSAAVGSTAAATAAPAIAPTATYSIGGVAQTASLTGAQAAGAAGAGAAAAEAAGAAPSAAEVAAASVAPEIAPSAVYSVGGEAAAATTAGTKSAGGIFSAIRGLSQSAGKFAGNVGTFVKENPIASLLAAQAAGQLLTPGQAEQIEDLRREEEKRRNANQAVGGVDLGLAVTDQQRPLLDTSGNQVFGKPVGQGGVLAKSREAYLQRAAA